MSWHGGTVGTVTGRDNVTGTQTGPVLGIQETTVRVPSRCGQQLVPSLRWGSGYEQA